MDPILAVAIVATGGTAVALAVHEAGHALAAVAVGGRDLRFERRGWRFVVTAALGDAPERKIAFLLGGVGANIAVGGALLAWAWLGRGGGLLAPVGVVVGVMNVLFAFVNALPHGTSDGARLLAIARNDDVRNDDGALSR